MLLNARLNSEYLSCYWQCSEKRINVNACISNADCGTGNNPIWQKWKEYQEDEERGFMIKSIFNITESSQTSSHLFSPAVSIGFLGQFLQLVFKLLSLSQEGHHQLCLVPQPDVVSVVEPTSLLPDQSCSLLYHTVVILHGDKLANKQVPGQQNYPLRKPFPFLQCLCGILLWGRWLVQSGSGLKVDLVKVTCYSLGGGLAPRSCSSSHRLLASARGLQ